MTSGKDEPITVEPFWIFGIVLEKFVPKGISHGGKSHWQAWMAAIGLVYRIHGEHSNAVDAELVEGGSRSDHFD